MGALGGQDRKKEGAMRTFGASWGHLGAVLKSMSKSIKKSMPFKIGFWSDFGGFWEGKWRHVGPKIEQKSMPTSKSDFLKNRALPAAGARFSRCWGANLGIKINDKSIQKWNQDGKASWHRFLMDFDGFWEASWEGKWSQDRSQEASKKGRKSG